jgi:hypothetical protein
MPNVSRSCWWEEKIWIAQIYEDAACCIVLLTMLGIGVSDWISLAEALGIIGTFIAGFYYSRKQMKSLSVDIETKVLNDLNEKLHGIQEKMIRQPELIKVVRDVQRPDLSSPEFVFAYHVLYVFAHAFHMRRRDILSDNEWTGWLLWMRNSFQEGTIKKYWRDLQIEKWFDPAFQEFMNNEIVGSREEGKDD